MPRSVLSHMARQPYLCLYDCLLCSFLRPSEIFPRCPVWPYRWSREGSHTSWALKQRVLPSFGHPLLSQCCSISPIAFWLQLVYGSEDDKNQSWGIGQCVTSFYKPEVSLTHLPVGLGEYPRMGSACPPLLRIGELDVASEINGADVVRKIPHLALLYQFQQHRKVRSFYVIVTSQSRSVYVGYTQYRLINCMSKT